MGTILHITTRTEWEAARDAGHYTAPSLHTEGFIHCSDPDQLVRVADGIFRGRSGLVLLCLDTDRIEAEIRYENCEGGELLFPHVYGPIATAAVTDVVPFPSREDGTFELPRELRDRP